MAAIYHGSGCATDTYCSVSGCWLSVQYTSNCPRTTSAAVVDVYSRKQWRAVESANRRFHGRKRTDGLNLIYELNHIRRGDAGPDVWLGPRTEYRKPCLATLSMKPVNPRRRAQRAQTAHRAERRRTLRRLRVTRPLTE